jgi:hypothetical protein
MKGYIALDIHNFEVLISRNVQFEETIFPYPISSHTQSWEFLSYSPTPSNHEITNGYQTTYQTSSSPSPVILPTLPPNADIDCHTPIPDTIITTADEVSTSHHHHIEPPVSPTLQPPLSSSPPPIPNPPRQSTRHRQPPIHLLDYHCALVGAPKTPYPITNFISHTNLSPSYSSYCLSLLSEQEPTTYFEASKSDQWVKAMQLELRALESNHTWIITDLPTAAKAIGSKWVFDYGLANVPVCCRVIIHTLLSRMSYLLLVPSLYT